MLNYILIIISALLFSLNFFSSKLFQQTAGDGLIPSIAKTLYAAVISVIFYIVVIAMSTTDTFEFSWLSFALALTYTVNNFVMAFASFKAFKYADLAIYSIFIMLGSIVIPSIVGILFYKEAFTIYTAICYVFILLALFVTVKKSSKGKIAYLFYFLVFVANGAAGVIAKINSESAVAVSSNMFLLIGCICEMVIATIIVTFALIKSRKNNKTITKDKRPLPTYITLKAILIGVIGGVVNAIAQALNIGTLDYVNISVHSVITTGGVIVFSALVSVMNKEKLSLRTILSMIFSIVAVVFATLPW